ncbi:MAG: MarR family transcriptional regulator [Thermoleophilaceae bacterium]|nr:MarR family transcriptional regulator [Thermoleophilaceae bacterium]
MDLAIIIAGANRALAERLSADLATAGFDFMRPGFGYVMRSLGDDSATLTELAERLDVSKQALKKVVDEMESIGLIERHPHAVDKRAKLLMLSAAGLRARAAALATSAQIEAELRERIGEDAVDATRAVLLDFIERQGGMDDMRAMRARPMFQL